MTGHVGALVDGDHLADGLHDCVVLHVQAFERLCRKPFLFLDKTQQDVLCADVGLMEVASLVLSQHEHLARLIGELVE